MGRQLLADQRDHLQVAVVEVLEHDPGDTGALVGSELLRRLLERAEDAGASPRRLVLVRVDRLACALEPAADPLARLVRRAPDHANRHQRERDRRPALALAGLQRAARAAPRTPPASRRSCCTRRPTLRRDGSCRSGRCRRRSGAGAACRPRSGGRPGSAPRASRGASSCPGRGSRRCSCSASIQPVPIPSETRPPAISFAVAEAFASTAAGRNVTGETSVPSSSCVVCAASAAITVQASSAGRSGSVCER